MCHRLFVKAIWGLALFGLLSLFGTVAPGVTAGSHVLLPLSGIDLAGPAVPAWNEGETPALLPKEADPLSFASEVLDLINQERANYGLAPLASNGALEAAAYGHSQDMSANDFFSHTGSDGSTLTVRIARAGYTGYCAAGENIAAGYSSPQAVVSAWMSSSGHRANILNAVYRDAGVGYVYEPGDTYPNGWGYKHYWTLDLGSRDCSLPATPVSTATPTRTFTPTWTLTPARTATPTRTHTLLWTATLTRSFTPTPTNTYTLAWTPTPVRTSTPTRTYTPLWTATLTRSFTPTPTNTYTLAWTPTPARTATPTRTYTPLWTTTPTRPSTPTPTATHTYTATPTYTSTLIRVHTPAWTATPTPTNSPPIAVLLGTVELEGRPPSPHPRWRVSLTLTFGDGSSPLATTGVETAENGEFRLTGLTPGIYDIRVRGGTTLVNLKRQMRLWPGENRVHLGVLVEGDANADNLIDIRDFSLMRAMFGTRSPQADFNGDGLVDILDFSLLRTNFGRAGDILVP